MEEYLEKYLNSGTSFYIALFFEGESPIIRLWEKAKEERNA